VAARIRWRAAQRDYMEKHDALTEGLAVKAEQYRKAHGYEAPYRELVSLGGGEEGKMTE